MSTLSSYNHADVIFQSVAESLDHPDWSWFRYQILALGSVMEVVGIPILLAILSYEKFGCDPQKRTIMNRLAMNLVYNCLGAYMTSILTLLIRLIAGPLPEILVQVTFFFSNAFSGTSSLLAITVMTILRFLSIFIWKRVPPLDDDFFSHYLISLNYVVSFMLAFFGRFGRIETNEMYHILTDRYLIANSNEPTFR